MCHDVWNLLHTNMYKLQALGLTSLETSLVNDLKSDERALEQDLKSVSILEWGYVNPDTGMARAQCDDTVTEGR